MPYVVSEKRKKNVSHELHLCTHLDDLMISYQFLRAIINATEAQSGKEKCKDDQNDDDVLRMQVQSAHLFLQSREKAELVQMKSTMQTNHRQSERLYIGQCRSFIRSQRCKICGLCQARASLNASCYHHGLVDEFIRPTAICRGTHGIAPKSKSRERTVNWPQVCTNGSDYSAMLGRSR